MQKRLLLSRCGPAIPTRTFAKDRDRNTGDCVPYSFTNSPTVIYNKGCFQPIVLIREDLKFALLITEAVLSSQLFLDPVCWSGRSRTPDLPHDSPMLNKLSQKTQLFPPKVWTKLLIA